MNKQIIDLRSDTVTLPSSEMLDAIKTIKLEQNFIIENYIKNTIDRFLSTLDISNTELCDKSITSLYTIFTLLDPRFIIVYDDKLQEIKNQDIGKKNRFKIMDIFDLKK